jgi:DNA-binding MarR family transcriptional regulator
LRYSARVETAATEPPHPPAATSPVPAKLGEETGFLLRVAYADARRRVNDALPDRFPARTHEVLEALGDLGPRSQKDLAEVLHLNATIVVKLIDELERAGVVKRERNTVDRRSYTLMRTPAGRRALAELNAALQHAEDELTRNISRSEKRALDGMLTSVALHMNARRPLPQGLATRTTYLIGAAHLAVRDRANERLSALGIRTSLYGPLAILGAAGATSQRAIARQLGFTAAAAQQAVDRLEQAGLVRRDRSPDDRRAYALELTRRGVGTLSSARAVIADIHRDLAAILGGEPSRAELNRLLLRLLDRE